VIDFRYHLVSLIAVFLAVALGIVIGTTALNEPILADIKNQVSALEKDKRSLEDRTQTLQTQLDTTDTFADAVAPALVDKSLTGAKILLVVTNENVSQDTVDAVTALIGQAGGSVSGTISLKPEYSDPSTATSLQNYVTGSGLPPGVQLPVTDDAGQLVGSLLAQVLMIKPGGTVPTGAAISSVLAGLTALGVLNAEGDSVAPANYAVVLTAGAFTGSGAADRNTTVAELVSALDANSSGAVVSGDVASAADTGLVGVIRSDPALSAAVSTVDNVNAAPGQISTVLALGKEGKGTSGKYGVGEDTQPVPPVPTATP
jgi:copper transport outer membrane protein MctB